MSSNPVPTINRTDLTGDWFDSLERCFKWSDRLQQKPFSAASAVSSGGGGGLADANEIYYNSIYSGSISSADSLNGTGHV